MDDPSNEVPVFPAAARQRVSGTTNSDAVGSHDSIKTAMRAFPSECLQMTRMISDEIFSKKREIYEAAQFQLACLSHSLISLSFAAPPSSFALASTASYISLCCTTLLTSASPCTTSPRANAASAAAVNAGCSR